MPGDGIAFTSAGREQSNSNSLENQTKGVYCQLNKESAARTEFAAGT